MHSTQRYLCLWKKHYKVTWKKTSKNVWKTGRKPGSVLASFIFVFSLFRLQTPDLPIISNTNEDTTTMPQIPKNYFFYQSEVSRLELVQDLVLHVGVLPHRRLKVPHLPFDHLGKLENSSGEQRPVPPKDNFKEGPSNSATNAKDFESRLYLDYDLKMHQRYRHEWQFFKLFW